MAEAFKFDEQQNIFKKEGIEILVQMAKTGKIDPWNIDIVDVTDKYLAHLFEMKAQNLRTTSKTFLFASILLRLKSNVISFNEVLQRRMSVKLNRNRTVTLNDLIKQLEFYEKLEHKMSLKQSHERAKNRVRSYANLTATDIVNLAHEEFIENSIKSVQTKLEKIFNSEEKVELNELISIGISKVTAYIALLFLTADGKCDLQQDEFYSDLYVVKNNDDRTVESEN